MFEGEDGVELKEGEVSKGSFLHANVWARISSVCAGPIFNLILAYVIAVVIVNTVPNMAPIVAETSEGGAAAEAGIMAGDRITAIGGGKVYLYDEVYLFSYTNTGKEVTVGYERDGVKYEVRLTPKWDEGSGRYLLGITGGEYVESRGLDCLKYAWYQVRYSVINTYKSLGMLVQGRIGRSDVAGPVGIAVNVVGATYDVAKEYGWKSVLFNMLNITMLLSVNLGILNLLPVPALDGGRLIFLILEVIRGKPVPPEREGLVHFIGLVFFMILMVFLLFNDLVNIFQK
jgi:regulator of sigma E protease